MNVYGTVPDGIILLFQTISNDYNKCSVLYRQSRSTI